MVSHSRTPYGRRVPPDMVRPRRRAAHGLRDDQRRHPGELAEDIIGPYYLWRLLVDEAYQGRGYGAATIDAVVAYLRTRPGADVLLTSCGRARACRSRSTSTTASSRPARSSGTRWSFASTWTGGRMTTPSSDRGRRPALERLGRAHRLADDDEPRRPAAELADLVPVGRRRGAASTPASARRATGTSRDGRSCRSTSTPIATGDEVVTMEGEARIDPTDPPRRQPGLRRQVPGQDRRVRLDRRVVRRELPGRRPRSRRRAGASGDAR